MALTLTKIRRRGRKPLNNAPLAHVLNIRLTQEEHEVLIELGGSLWIREQIALGGEPVRAQHGRPLEYPGRPSRTHRFQCRASTAELRRFHILGGSVWLRRKINDVQTLRFNNLGAP